jgi:hypothetical protein
MMARLADQLDITAGPGGNGTIVRMRFGAHSARRGQAIADSFSQPASRGRQT